MLPGALHKAISNFKRKQFTGLHSKKIIKSQGEFKTAFLKTEDYRLMKAKG